MHARAIRLVLEKRTDARKDIFSDEVISRFVFLKDSTTSRADRCVPKVSSADTRRKMSRKFFVMKCLKGLVWQTGTLLGRSWRLWARSCVPLGGALARLERPATALGSPSCDIKTLLDRSWGLLESQNANLNGAHRFGGRSWGILA